MLTVILLVVLGGGVGLVAVSMAESQKTATNGSGSRRAETLDAGHTDPRRSARDPRPSPADRLPAPGSGAADGADVSPSGVMATVSAGAVAGDRRQVRPDPRDIPAQYTAIEGAFVDVVRPPMWRRGVSLVLIVVILLVVAVLIATVAGAAIGLGAGIINDAIG